MSIHEPVSVIPTSNNALGLELNGPLPVEQQEPQPAPAVQGNVSTLLYGLILRD